MNTLQLHGVYLIGVGTMMARHNKSAALVAQQYGTEIKNLMIARGATVEEAENQLARVYPADAINAQF
jgi:hypothetical protein